jgi:hypothetical protein
MRTRTSSGRRRRSSCSSSRRNGPFFSRTTAAALPHSSHSGTCTLSWRNSRFARSISPETGERGRAPGGRCDGRARWRSAETTGSSSVRYRAEHTSANQRIVYVADVQRPARGECRDEASWEPQMLSDRAADGINGQHRHPFLARATTTFSPPAPAPHSRGAEARRVLRRHAL